MKLLNKLLEEEMSKNNTDVISELEKMELDYKEDLKKINSSDEEIKINRILSEITKMKIEYGLYKENGSMQRSIWYEASVTACITYFNMNGYKLSTELLVQAKVNKKLDSYYNPSARALTSITQSSKYWEIRDGKSTSGSAAFPNFGSVSERDCYYAIHKFSYTKPSSSSKKVIITDRYDYDNTKNYSGIEGVAVNAMYEAQQAGYLTPFKLKITLGS